MVRGGVWLGVIEVASGSISAYAFKVIVAWFIFFGIPGVSTIRMIFSVMGIGLVFCRAIGVTHQVWGGASSIGISWVTFVYL